MKNTSHIIGIVALSFVALFSFNGVAHAVSPNDLEITQRNSTNDGNVLRLVPVPTDGGTGWLVLDGVSIVPQYRELGYGLIDDGFHVRMASSTISDMTGLQSALDSKMGSTTLATVATSGAYSDLTGKPSAGVAYEGTNARASAFPIFKSATVSSGTAVFNLTADGTSGGTALCTNGVIADSVSTTVSDATASYQMAWAFSNSNKTLTVTTNKLTTANILTGILGQTQANSSVVKMSVWCY